jgi:hypothetical protein
VDIDAGDALVERIKPYAKRTMRPEVLAGIGGFGALVEVGKRFREPVLVAGTDGVGTKLDLALRLNRHDTIGIDLVAMSVNDVLVQGAEPLFFLDYFVCEKLDVDVAADVIKGIAHGCGIQADDSLWCWGNELLGEVGTGVANAHTPNPILGGGQWSVSGYRRGTNWQQGYTNVADFAGTFAVGIEPRRNLRPRWSTRSTGRASTQRPFSAHRGDQGLAHVTGGGLA